MKKNFCMLIVLMLGLILNTTSLSAQNIFPAAGSVGIGTTTPASSAALDIVSTSQGVLVPRMTKSQRDAIVSPVFGLLIYQTNSAAGFYYYSGSAWTAVSTAVGANKSLSNLNATSVNQSLVANAANTLDLGSSTNGWKNLYLSGKINQGSISLLNLTNLNSAIGYAALASNTGVNNTAVGTNALVSNTTGTQNTAVGDSCLIANTTGYYLTGVGFGALRNNTSGMRNAAFGYDAMASNTTGKSNAAFGVHTMFYNTSGQDNTAIGAFTMEENTTGDNNVAVGKSAMVHCLTGKGNVGIGSHALYSNTAASNQVAVGDSALSFNEGGTGQNTAIGGRAALNNTAGSSNSYFGYSSGITNLTGNQLTLVGALTDVSTSSISNAAAIGYGTTVTTADAMRFGNSSVIFWGFGANAVAGKALIVGSSSSNGNGAFCTTGGSWTNGSSRDLKENFSSPDKWDVLSKINQLSISRWMYKGTENEYHIGPIAEDFYAAFHVGHDDKSISTIDPAGVALIGIQALSEENVALKKENVELKSQLNSVLDRLDLIEQSLSQCCTGFQAPNHDERKAKQDDEPKLNQNSPNPFYESTTIDVYLPASMSNAALIITDLEGQVVKQISIVNSSGTHALAIESGDLPAGSYNYSLVADGKTIATRKMELTK